MRTSSHLIVALLCSVAAVACSSSNDGSSSGSGSGSGSGSSSSDGNCPGKSSSPSRGPRPPPGPPPPDDGLGTSDLQSSAPCGGGSTGGSSPPPPSSSGSEQTCESHHLNGQCLDGPKKGQACCDPDPDQGVECKAGTDCDAVCTYCH